jgi:F-type H+-transporting ATPase subunit b
VSPTLTTFLFEAANFLVLAGVLGWLFFKPVRQALAERREKLETEAREAARKLADAEKIRQEIDAARAGLEKELNDLRSRELDAARRHADQVLAEARGAAERELETARRQAARMSDAQRNTLAQVATAATAEVVGRLLEQIGGPDLHSALIRSACEQLRSLPREGLAPVKIESESPLSQEERAAVEGALGGAAQGADFRTAGELGAGVRISTGRGLIDASVNGLTRFAGQSLLKEMSRGTNNDILLQINRDA